MKVDILAFAAHPDDIEISCSGTLMKHIEMGYKVAVIDLTQGELGTRGNVATRKKEASEASKILGIVDRQNLKMEDCFFHCSESNKKKVISMIRKYQPKLVFANSVKDRHPDHAKASNLVSEACFLSGLPKVKTELNGVSQNAWRPKAVYHYIQDYYIEPDFIVDISNQMDKKMMAIKAFKTQFYNPDSKEPETPISREDFLEFIKARARNYGRLIKKEYAEGFTVEVPLMINDVLKTIE
ncbi:MAG: bacillithiol biosynthesis deacetylase BshB1 [Flavobacteriales bacterium]|nr:bacillithiol biosynthesis deacetylase BshB1 [Flavobacteriales bacterium]